MGLVNFDRGTMMCLESSTRSLKTIADNLPTAEERKQQMFTTLVAAMLTKGHNLETAIEAAKEAYQAVSEVAMQL